MADPSTYRPAPGEIPVDPGVYRFRDRDGRVIYVGKAKSLRPRLSSYFQDLSALHLRTSTMVTTAASVEWTVVSTRSRPSSWSTSGSRSSTRRSNAGELPDDKSYPYLAVTLGDESRVGTGDAGAKRAHALLRALRPRLGDPGDPRPHAEGVPHAHLLVGRVQEGGPGGRGRARWGTSQVLGALRGPRPRGSTVPSPRTSATSWRGTRPSSCAADVE